MRAGRSTCTGLKLLVTEFGSGSSPGGFSSFETSFPRSRSSPTRSPRGSTSGPGPLSPSARDPALGELGRHLDRDPTPALRALQRAPTVVGERRYPTNVTPSTPSVAVVATEAGANTSRTNPRRERQRVGGGDGPSPRPARERRGRHGLRLELLLVAPGLRPREPQWKLPLAPSSDEPPDRSSPVRPVADRWWRSTLRRTRPCR